MCGEGGDSVRLSNLGVRSRRDHLSRCVIVAVHHCWAARHGLHHWVDTQIRQALSTVRLQDDAGTDLAQLRGPECLRPWSAGFSFSGCWPLATQSNCYATTRWPFLVGTRSAIAAPVSEPSFWIIALAMGPRPPQVRWTPRCCYRCLRRLPIGSQRSMISLFLHRRTGGRQSGGAWTAVEDGSPSFRLVQVVCRDDV